MEQHKHVIQHIYKLIPKGVRKSLSPFLSGFYLPVHQFTYTSDSIDHRVDIVYLGINKDRARVWGKRILEDEFIQSQKERVWIWSLNRYLTKNVPDCNLVMVETNWVTEIILTPLKGFKMPMWVQFCLDVSRPLKKLKKSCKRLNDDIPRQIRKYSLELEISNSEKDLDEFIDSMHIPYIRGRHKDTAFITNREPILETFRRSDLFFITRDGQRISGVLVEYQNKIVTLHYIGLKDNNPEFLQMGAVSALYYFAIQHAHEKGFTVLNMGGTNPFIADGLAYFKLSLKPYVTKTTYLADYSIKFILRKSSVLLDNFLTKNPFLYLSKGEIFERLVFVDNSETWCIDDLSELLKRTHCDNVVTTVFALRHDSPEARELLTNIVPAQTRIRFSNWDAEFNQA